MLRKYKELKAETRSKNEQQRAKKCNIGFYKDPPRQRTGLRLGSNLTYQLQIQFCTTLSVISRIPLYGNQNRFSQGQIQQLILYNHHFPTLTTTKSTVKTWCRLKVWHFNTKLVCHWFWHIIICFHPDYW